MICGCCSGTPLHTEYELPAISDHSPMLLIIHQTIRSPRIPFKFFNIWSTHPGCLALVEGVWKKRYEGRAMKVIWAKLKALRPLLKSLKTEEYKGVAQKIYQGQK